MILNYLKGAKVNHEQLGMGTIVEINETNVKIDFKSDTKEYGLETVFKKGIIKFINSDLNNKFLDYLKQLQDIKQQKHNQKLDEAERHVAEIKMNNGKVFSKKITTDFTHIVRGNVYGTNSRTIYENFCDSLGWDKNKADQFGWQTPLYATNADTNRINDVWFIFYANYDPEKLDSVVGNFHVVNLIQNNGDKIIEVVDDSIGRSNNANRITFIKTHSGYEFFGVYELVQNGTKRIYKRISDSYPL